MKFSRSNFKMQRFESRNPRLESWGISIPECGGSNPAAPASECCGNSIVRRECCKLDFDDERLPAVGERGVSGALADSGSLSWRHGERQRHHLSGEDLVVSVDQLDLHLVLAGR
jgi:hypothetical protein